ncbi:MAG: hypothetical protein IAF02_23775 [Anaerolineae bacterium]|nr:hypothetical protein [Anaerolineae bacterium]
MELIITFSIIVIVIVLIFILARRQQSAKAPTLLRPFSAHKALKGQVGRAVESASRLHISLGRGSLIGAANPVSLSAVSILDRLAQDGCANDTPPITTVGDGTLLPIADNHVRFAAELAGNSNRLPNGTIQFVADSNNPFTYAGGVTNVIQQEKILGNILVGQFGQEIGIITEVASRNQINQVIGSDDPLALAVATTATDDIMIGEELLASPAYIEGKPFQIASLQVQDILRVVVGLAILGTAVYKLVTG